MQSESFFELLQWVRGQSTKAKLVYLLLCFVEAEENEIVGQGQDAIANELEMSMDSVNRGLKELRQAG